MMSKLEQKLLKYDSGTPIDDSELIEIIEKIIAEEESLPVEKRDFDLIEEAVDAVLSLKGVDLEYLDHRAEDVSEKRISEQKAENRRPVSTRRKTLKLARLIPIAAAFVLIVSTLAVSASNPNIFSNVYSYIKNKIYPVSEITSVGEFYTYDTVMELSAAVGGEKFLLPHKLPDGFSVKDISVQISDVETSKDNFKNSININVKLLHDSSQQKLSITSDIDDSFENGGKTKIGDYDVYYRFTDNTHIGRFVHGENGYTVTASTYENLTAVIECLTEIE